MNIDDYLSAEPLLIQRLSDKVSLVDAGDIQPIDDAGQKSASTQQRSKVILVQFFDDQVDSGRDGKGVGGYAQFYIQRWLIVVSTRNLSDSTGLNARAAAGPIISEVKKALQNHTLSENHSPLAAKNGSYRPRFISGVYSHPMIFETRVSITGLRD